MNYDSPINPEKGMIALSDLDHLVAKLSTLPVDLTDERLGEKGKRFWDAFMTHMLSVGNTRRDLEFEWMGFNFTVILSDVRHQTFTFGIEGSKSLGKLIILKVSGNPGNTMVLAHVPIRTGGSSYFMARASNEEFTDTLKIFARSILTD